MTNYLGIDIGGTTVKFGVVSDQGEIKEFGKFTTLYDKEQLLDKIAALAKKFAGYELAGLGISTPGFVTKEGILTTAGAIKSLYNVNMKEELAKRTTLPITIENDANCAALAENWLGTGEHLANFLLVTVGTGIGGGIIFEHQLMRGSKDRAGEFGFMVLDPVIADDTRIPSLSKVGAMTSLYNFYYLQSNQRLEDGKEIFKLAGEGNIWAATAVRRFIHQLGVGIYNLSMCFDPEAIIIGGAISENENFLQLLNSKVRELFNGHSGLFTDDPSPVLPARFLNQAGVIGAVSQFCNH